MAEGFTSFVVFAEMRTGSNFLESNLNALEGVACHGEAFNPHFIGYPNNTPILGVDLATRDRDPRVLLDAIRSDDSQLSGFRYFHDHDPRVFDAIIEDRSCAKIVLTRNPVESYVSWKIAQQTGQWKLTNVGSRKAGQAHFDPQEFAEHLEALRSFQITLLNRLQVSGQTAFYVAYEDLQSVDVMNGLAAYLGVPARLEGLDTKLKKQNPKPVSAKVRNYDEMVQALSLVDHFDLTRTPNFEPRRGPNVPSYVVAAESPLLFMPLRGGPTSEVMNWMAALDRVPSDALAGKLTQKDLRQWKRKHPGHRSFTVLRHPVSRAHDAFCRHILPVGPGSYLQLRKTLVKHHDVPLPEAGPDASYDLAAHRAGFVGFLRFLKANLSAQTSVRVDAAWCTQTQSLAGFGELCLPDRLIREESMEQELAALASEVGCSAVPQMMDTPSDAPFALDAVYDDEIEALVADAYQRDYVMLGFMRWA